MNEWPEIIKIID